MAKKQTRMVIFDEESLVCSCGATMEFRGFLYDKIDGEYNHICPSCGHKEYHRERYPKLTRKRYGKI